MSFLIGSLLLYVEESSAFHIFRYLLEHRGMLEIYQDVFTGPTDFEKILSKKIPEISKLLNDFSFPISSIVQPWA